MVGGVLPTKLMEKHTKHLTKMVREGPETDIFKAEQAISFINTTETFSKEINANNLGEVFGTLQNFCVEQFVLSISKLYEPPRASYPLMSIPAILEYFKNNAQHLKIIQGHQLKEQLVRLGLYVNEFDSLSPVEQNSFIHEKLSELSPNVRGNATFKALKALRDKKIAHSEHINFEALPKTKISSAEELLQYPKDVISVIGIGYLNIFYVINGEYILSSDAHRTGRGTHRLLSKLDVKNVGT